MHTARPTSRLLARWTAAALAGLALAGAHAEHLSAPAAEAALSAGALAWDVREAAAGLPGALRINATTLAAWLEHGDLTALQAAVSRAGLDLSRDIVVYGDAGDIRAQALVASLQGLSRGRVHWFVGGVAEWSMSGRPLQAAVAARLPVPQRLVADTAAGAPVMAGAALRDGPGTALFALR